MRLEQQLEHLQRQLGEAKPLADRWTPVVSGELRPGAKQVHVTLAFGGRRTTAVVSVDAFRSNTVDDLTISIIDTLAESLLIDCLREVIRPEVERLARGAQALPRATV